MRSDQNSSPRNPTGVYSNKDSHSSFVDATTNALVLESVDPTIDSCIKDRQIKQSLQRAKKKAKCTNKNKAKDNYLKVHKTSVAFNVTKPKSNILDEEDSLHATTDLGGTTIPAEPCKG